MNMYIVFQIGHNLKHVIPKVFEVVPLIPLPLTDFNERSSLHIKGAGRSADLTTKIPKAKGLRYFFLNLDAQSAPGMSYFSFKVQKCPIFNVPNPNRENFNGSALWYFSYTIPRTTFEKE